MGSIICPNNRFQSDHAWVVQGKEDISDTTKTYSGTASVDSLSRLN